MKSKIIFYFFILIIAANFSRCTNHFKNSLIGKYESSVPKFTLKSYSIGNTIILKSDSTFYYETCGEIMYGKWETNNSNDSLLLYCTEFKYKNDSIDKVLPKIWDRNLPFESYKISRSGYLVQKTSSFYDKLKRVP